MDQNIGSTLYKLIFISAYTFGVRASLITYINLSKRSLNPDPKLDERIPSYLDDKISSTSLT